MQHERSTRIGDGSNNRVVKKPECRVNQRRSQPLSPTVSSPTPLPPEHPRREPRSRLAVPAVIPRLPTAHSISRLLSAEPLIAEIFRDISAGTGFLCSGGALNPSKVSNPLLRGTSATQTILPMTSEPMATGASSATGDDQAASRSRYAPTFHRRVMTASSRSTGIRSLVLRIDSRCTHVAPESHALRRRTVLPAT